MIHPERYYEYLVANGIDFFTGVPDSLLKDVLALIDARAPNDQHVITANEGLSVGLAAGYHLATGKIPLVYLQNSGLGNLVNPITSLADREMYGIPMLLMIGWRGRPGVKDEPQHRKMGRITLPMLEAMELPYFIGEPSETIFFQQVKEAIHLAQTERQPVALVIPEQFFEPVPTQIIPNPYSLRRSEVIETIVRSLQVNETVIATTGKIGRVFDAINAQRPNPIERYLLCVGAMGHANHIALGIQLASQRVVMLDGDGAMLMQLGSLPTIAHHATGDFIHVVLNNGCHASVGGQPTEGFRANLSAMADAAGYPFICKIEDMQELEKWIREQLPLGGLQFIEIRISNEDDDNPGRPSGEPWEWKQRLTNLLQQPR